MEQILPLHSLNEYEICFVELQNFLNETGGTRLQGQGEKGDDLFT